KGRATRPARAPGCLEGACRIWSLPTLRRRAEHPARTTPAACERGRTARSTAGGSTSLASPPIPHQSDVSVTDKLSFRSSANRTGCVETVAKPPPFLDGPAGLAESAPDPADVIPDCAATSVATQNFLLKRRSRHKLTWAIHQVAENLELSVRQAGLTPSSLHHFARGQRNLHLPNGQKRPRLRALLLQHQPSPLEQLERRDAIECVDGTAPQCKCDRRRPELAEHPDLGSGPRPDVFDNPTSLCTSRLVPDKCARACTRARHSIRGGEPSSPSQSRNPLRQHSPVSL